MTGYRNPKGIKGYVYHLRIPRFLVHWNWRYQDFDLSDPTQLKAAYSTDNDHGEIFLNPNSFKDWRNFIVGVSEYEADVSRVVYGYEAFYKASARLVRDVRLTELESNRELFWGN